MAPLTLCLCKNRLSTSTYDVLQINDNDGDRKASHLVLTVQLLDFHRTRTYTYPQMTLLTVQHDDYLLNNL